jgi:hypothetical protein
MATAKYINTFSNDYGTKLADIKRRQKMAELLAQQGAEPIDVESVGGIPTPISPFQGLAKVLKSGMGGYLAGKASEDEAALEKAGNEELVQAVSRFGKPYKTVDEAAPTVMSGDEPLQQYTMKTPDSGEMLGEASRIMGLGVPGSEAIGAKLYSTASDAAERETAYNRLKPYIDAIPNEEARKYLNIAAQADPTKAATYFGEAGVELIKPRKASNRNPFPAVGKDGKPGMFVMGDDGLPVPVAGMTPFRQGGGDGGGPGGPFGGKSMAAQFMNTIIKGETSSPEYAMAYNSLSKPRTEFDQATMRPVTIPGMDMSQFPKPSGPVAAGSTGLTPVVGPAIGETRDIKDARVTLKVFDEQLKALEQDLKKPTLAEKSLYATTGVSRGGMASALGSYNALVTISRDPVLINTGVLQPAELQYMNNFLNNPGTIKGMLSGDKSTIEAFTKLQGIVSSRLKAKQEVYGTGPAAPGPGAGGAGGNSYPSEAAAQAAAKASGKKSGSKIKVIINGQPGTMVVD